MVNVNVSELRKTMSQALAERANNLSMNETRRKAESRAYFLGAEQAFKAEGNDVAALNMREAYSIVVETGFKTVLKWAGIDEKIEAPQETKAA